MPEVVYRGRDEVWDEATERLWDVVVVGGGITGAGIAREAARSGFTTLLLEQKDFAWGTSSRSSKMIHGGLRYLKERQIQLTREAVRERERLLRAGRGLVEPLRFLYLVYRGDRPGSWTLDFGLTIYDLLKRGGRSYHSPDLPDIKLLAPNLNFDGLRGGFVYSDAQTDDARLVFRVLREAEHSGARKLNYAPVEELLQDNQGNVRALAVRDAAGGNVVEVRARHVVNAAGVWTGGLQISRGESPRLRPLRGSHLVFPWSKLPTAHAITFAHPEDGRPVFAYPWEGVTLVGTTDLDHEFPLREEPAISPEETEYLLGALQARFGEPSISTRDLLGTFAGVRPVVFGGRDKPSQEPREYAIQKNDNLITVAGGKLTTFHLIARRVVQELPNGSDTNASESLDPLSAKVLAEAEEALSRLSHMQRRRLVGRLGPDLEGFLAWTSPDDLEEIPGTPYTWTELRWAFSKESVEHLDDLLLRRVRLGHLLTRGGLTLRREIEDQLRPLSDWDPERWKKEWERYQKLWDSHYSPVPGEGGRR